MVKITINTENTKKVTVSVRAMSAEHWKALRKLAMIEDKPMAEYIAKLVEEKINGDTSNE